MHKWNKNKLKVATKKKTNTEIRPIHLRSPVIRLHQTSKQQQLVEVAGIRWPFTPILEPASLRLTGPAKRAVDKRLVAKIPFEFIYLFYFCPLLVLLVATHVKAKELSSVLQRLPLFCWLFLGLLLRCHHTSSTIHREECGEFPVSSCGVDVVCFSCFWKPIFFFSLSSLVLPSLTSCLRDGFLQRGREGERYKSLIGLVLRLTQ